MQEKVLLKSHQFLMTLHWLNLNNSSSKVGVTKCVPFCCYWWIIDTVWYWHLSWICIYLISSLHYFYAELNDQRVPLSFIYIQKIISYQNHLNSLRWPIAFVKFFKFPLWHMSILLAHRCTLQHSNYQSSYAIIIYYLQ